MKKILAMHAKRMTVRDIQGLPKDIYGTEVSPTLISNVTDTRMNEASALWGYNQNHPSGV